MGAPKCLATLAPESRESLVRRIERDGEKAVAAAIGIHPVTLLKAAGGGRVFPLVRNAIEREMAITRSEKVAV
jgi:hypothetical protein